MIDKDKLAGEFKGLNKLSVGTITNQAIQAIIDSLQAMTKIKQKKTDEMMDELVVDGHAHALIRDDGTVAHIPNSEIRKQPEKKV